MKKIYFDGEMYSAKDLVSVMTDEKIDDGQYSIQTVLDMRDVIIELLDDLQRNKNIQGEQK